MTTKQSYIYISFIEIKIPVGLELKCELKNSTSTTILKRPLYKNIKTLPKLALISFNNLFCFVSFVLLGFCFHFLSFFFLLIAFRSAIAKKRIVSNADCTFYLNLTGLNM